MSINDKVQGPPHKSAKASRAARARARQRYEYNDTYGPAAGDLRNVGFALQNDQRRTYRRGNENFTLRVEKKNLGLNKVRYWKHNNKMIYLVPLNDGTVVTIYGNIDTKSAIEIARNIKK